MKINYHECKMCVYSEYNYKADKVWICTKYKRKCDELWDIEFDCKYRKDL